MEVEIEKNDEYNVRVLYKSLLENWNTHNATAFANLFARDGSVVGFDGSQLNGQQEINDELTKIFASHKVSSYVSIIREVRVLSATVFLLRAVAGMVPPGKSAINPEVNAIQTLCALKEQGQFRIAMFQNTAAAFHGRPELSQRLTEELQQAFNDQQKIQSD